MDVNANVYANDDSVDNTTSPSDTHTDKSSTMQSVLITKRINNNNNITAPMMLPRVRATPEELLFKIGLQERPKMSEEKAASLHGNVCEDVASFTELANHYHQLEVAKREEEQRRIRDAERARRRLLRMKEKNKKRRSKSPVKATSQHGSATSTPANNSLVGAESSTSLDASGSVSLSGSLGSSVGFAMSTATGFNASKSLTQASTCSQYTDFAKVPVAIAERNFKRKDDKSPYPIAPASAASASLAPPDPTSLSAAKFVTESFAAQEAAGGPTSRRERCSAKLWRKWNYDLRILEEASIRDAVKPIVLPKPHKLERTVLKRVKAFTFADPGSEPTGGYFKPADFRKIGTGVASLMSESLHLPLPQGTIIPKSIHILSPINSGRRSTSPVRLDGTSEFAGNSYGRPIVLPAVPSSRPGSPFQPVALISPAVAPSDAEQLRLLTTSGTNSASTENAPVDPSGQGTQVKMEAEFEDVYGELQYDENGEALNVDGMHLLPGFDALSFQNHRKKVEIPKETADLDASENTDKDIGDIFCGECSITNSIESGSEPRELQITFDDVISISRPPSGSNLPSIGRTQSLPGSPFGSTRLQSPSSSVHGTGRVGTSNSLSAGTSVKSSSLTVPGGSMTMQSRRVVPNKSTGAMNTKDCDIVPLDLADKFVGTRTPIARFGLAQRFRRTDVQPAAPGAEVTVGGPILRADGLQDAGCKFTRGPRGNQIRPHSDQPGPGEYKVPRMFDIKKGQGKDITALVEKARQEPVGYITYDTNQMVDLLQFAFGCSFEEHLKYGRCLDGLCGRRSKFEQAILATNDETRAKGLNSYESEMAKELMADCSRPLSAILVAVYRCDHATIRSMAFIKEGVNEKEFATGNTPLHVATIRCRIDAVVTLMDTFGDYIDVNSKNNVGDTPLMIACREGFNELVSLLCDAGAIPFNITNNKGETCLNVARTHQITQILKLAADENDLEADLMRTRQRRENLRELHSIPGFG